MENNKHSSQTAYQLLAEYYELFFPVSQQKIRFFYQMQPENQPGFLDVACGNGILAEQLARQGLTVSGIDLSEAMVERAKQNAEYAVFQQADMLQIKQAVGNQKFGQIVCLGNSIPHLQSIEEVLTFFEQVFTLLVPGARFTLQIINYDYILNANIQQLPLIDIGRFQLIRHYEHEESKLIFKITIKDRQQGKEYHSQVSLRPFTWSMIREQLLKAGFSGIKRYADYDCRPAAEKDWSYLAISQRI